jgi:predicted thioredoxin/glutaredoxin
LITGVDSHDANIYLDIQTRTGVASTPVVVDNFVLYDLITEIDMMTNIVSTHF